MKNKINILEKDINIINKLQKGTSLQKRACQIFQILLLNKKFKNFIYKIRKEMKIPISGLNLSDKDENIVKNRF